MRLITFVHRNKGQQKLIRLIILFFCLFAGTLVSSADINTEYLLVETASETFGQNFPDIDLIADLELSDADENEEEEVENDYRYSNPSRISGFNIQSGILSCISSTRNITHLIINLFANLPPPFQEDQQYS